MPFLLDITLFAFVAVSCIVDVRTRRIPNAISGPAMLVGVALNALYYGSSGLVWSLAGLAAMITILLAPFALGGLGGGDVKMMAAVGAFLGPRLALSGLAVGMAVGGIVMAIHLVRIGRFAEKLGALKTMIGSMVITRSVAPLQMAADAPGAISLPYSIPLGLGTAAVVLAARIAG
jgi:prepilin peptidase CpaA